MLYIISVGKIYFEKKCNIVLLPYKLIMFLSFFLWEVMRYFLKLGRAWLFILM